MWGVSVKGYKGGGTKSKGCYANANDNSDKKDR